MKHAPHKAKWAHCVPASTGSGSCSPVVGVSVTRRTAAIALSLLVVIAAVASCTSSSNSDPSKSPTTSTAASVTSSSPGAPTSVSTPTTSPTSTSPGDDPRGKAASSAYVAFTRASQAAERTPTDLSLAKALNKLAVDPALSTEGEHLFGYRNSGIAWKGQPPAPRVSVESIVTSGTYPTVTLTDCPTISGTWMPYIVTTHKSVPVTYPPGSAKPPHAVTVKVIYYRAQWLVQSTTTDVKNTCAP